ncbi:protease-4 [Cohaesibacter sp. ES.047]|nr:protease-4 [Cohaesibacter sp. ES.047]
MRRKLSTWRIVAILSLIALVVGFGLFAVFDGAEQKQSKDHIAKVTFDGVILGETRKIKLLEELAESDKVKGVVVSINSPGGATSGGEALYDALVKLGKKKPMVTSMDALAASAGYMIALPAERIFARRSSITGSIGVIFQYTDITELMKKVGVEMRAIKSAPLKAEPNPFSPHSDEAEAMIANMIDDSYQWFVDLVTKHRPFDRARALELADGRVVTGGQAVDLQLVDELGGPEAAKDWLLREHDLPADLELVEWKPAPLRDNLPFGLASRIVANWLPEPILELFETRNQVGKLDGLVSVWQAQKTK